MHRNDWKTVICDRYVQTSLLWELQKYFLNLLPDAGVSPDCHEAIILCILSFPDINCEIDENLDCAMTSGSLPNEVCIEMHREQSTLSISLSVPFGPQTVHVAVEIQIDCKGEIKFAVSLCGEGRFIWEKWRNNFYSRLADRKQWQKNNKLHCVSLLLSKECITSGLRSARLVAFVTGSKMYIWPGWLPHREGLCPFEIESKCFIIEIKKSELYQQWSLSSALVKSRRVPAKYAAANRAALEHASVVSQKIFRDLMTCDIDEKQDSTMAAICFPIMHMRGVKLSGRSNRNTSLDLLKQYLCIAAIPTL